MLNKFNLLFLKIYIFNFFNQISLNLFNILIVYFMITFELFILLNTYSFYTQC